MTDAAAKAPDVPAGTAKRSGSFGEPLFEGLCFAAASILLAALIGIIVALLQGGWPIFQRFGLGFLTTVTWNPVTDVYGAAGPLVGTLVTSAISLILALPIAVGVAVFLVEICPARLRGPIASAVELLAGIPSIVYGMFGLFVFAPWFASHVQLPLVMSAQPGSLLEQLTSGVPNGANILTASIILALMILPFIAATLRELLLTVPPAMRESAYGLGSSTAEVIIKVSLPYISRSAVGAVMLGLGRALGETMAVTFIIGNSHDLPSSLFASGSTISSTIANEFNEASGLHLAALMALALVLFLITFVILALARLLIGARRAA
jgi:phosphate transport system permease protein